VSGETLGIEEEFQLVDAETYALRPRAEAVLEHSRPVLGEEVCAELNLSQIEIGTPVCHSLDEAASHLRRLRRAVDGAARATGSRLLATGTHPFTEWIGQAITPGERYDGLERQYQQLAREQLVCGCHVHVGVDDREMAVEVVDRAAPELATLIALTANSPFWQGVDTGYASYRAELFGRWPTAGPPSFLGSRAEYDRVVRELVATGTIADASFLYWDARPSTQFETVEFRVADVCSSVDEAVMVAGLVRAVTRRCLRQVREEEPAPRPRYELLEAARWRAARFGLDDTLVDVSGAVARPAADVVRQLLDTLRPDLEDTGDWELIHELVDRTLTVGNGATRQREIYRRTGDLREVVRVAAAETIGDEGLTEAAL
jgi:glutamate---cysteine ligase / carboxylate-amine ligase